MPRSFQAGLELVRIFRRDDEMPEQAVPAVDDEHAAAVEQGVGPAFGPEHRTVTDVSDIAQSQPPYRQAKPGYFKMSVGDVVANARSRPQQQAGRHQHDQDDQ